MWGRTAPSFHHHSREMLMVRFSKMSHDVLGIQRDAIRALLATGMLVACLAFATPAQATDRPWAAGVDKAAEAEARRHFEQGVGFLRDAFFTRAALSFEDSLARWDHPATHFNLAKALLNLDGRDRALHHMWAAMRHGGRPLTLDQVDQVERYAVTLIGEVSLVSIATQRKGSVSLNGVPLFEGPGTWIGLVNPTKARVEIDGGKRGQTTIAAVGRSRVDVRFGPNGAAVTAMRDVEKSDIEEVQMARLGFIVRYPDAEQRKAWRATTPPESSSWVDPGDALPGHAAAVCPAANEDLALVCKDFERVWRDYVSLQRESQRRADAAIRKLREMTAGGIVEQLE